MMPIPANAANSSPSHRPALGMFGKYIEVKYVYDAKYMKPATMSAYVALDLLLP